MRFKKHQKMQSRGNFSLSRDIKEACKDVNAAEGFDGLSWRTDYD